VEIKYQRYTVSTSMLSGKLLLEYDKNKSVVISWRNLNYVSRVVRSATSGDL